MAGHIQDQEELENFKYFWKSWGRWLFAVLLVASLGYLGYIVYQNHQVDKDREAASILENIVEKAQSSPDSAIVAEDLKTLQQEYTGSIATAQATLMAAAVEFDRERYDVAAGHLNWVLANQKAPLIQALAAQRLAVVQLQQKKYDEALAAVSLSVKPEFESLLLETKGDIYTAQGKGKEALEVYELALGKMSKDDPGLDLLQLKIQQLK